MGIERTIQQTHANTDKNISQAFQDLTKLMEKVCINYSLFIPVSFTLCVHLLVSKYMKKENLFKSQHLLTLYIKLHLQRKNVAI